ncbi:hypothetical protein H5V43_16910 [Sphingobium fuliginis]|jgi:hypothetical protein|uniref:Uncharacterized protein n=1 Tax=Sphingobium fuliginis (strain ATCC 27551) TaxID=336203 RepID=A0A7M2GP40_SPHSA|nr:hypothetical protein [Sphingobium fuliginis]QOT73842.1 hypothetical protein H5V43_16910 [Sphingobium fuliginis]
MTEHNQRLQDVAAAADPVAPLFTDGSRSAALIEWAGSRGIDAATILLAGELSRMDEHGQAAFVTAIVEEARIQPGDGLRWLLWLWNDAPTPIRSRLSEERDIRAVEEVMEIHRRALAGEAVSNPVWRAARRQFAAAMTPEAPAAAVEAIMSSMWDLHATPGAVADVASTWIVQSSAADAFEPAGWTAAEHHRVQSTWDAYGIEQAHHNRRLPGEDDAAFGERLQRYTLENPVPLSSDDFDNWRTWQAERQKIMTARVEELRAGLRGIVSR